MKLLQIDFYHCIFHLRIQKMNKIAPIDYEPSALSIVNFPNNIDISNLQTKDQTKVCKICLDQQIMSSEVLTNLDDQERKGLQLIVPCQCSGSVGYVHQKCIRTWILKQMQNSGHKIAVCEICKAQIFFRTKKVRYCDCRLKNLTFISSCNIITSIVQLFLLVVVIMVYRYSQGMYESNLLKYVLIVLMCILGLAFALTFLLMIGEAFVKINREIGKIYSLEQCISYGLRERTFQTNRQLGTKNTIKNSENPRRAAYQFQSIRMHGQRQEINHTLQPMLNR